MQQPTEKPLKEMKMSCLIQCLV